MKSTQIKLKPRLVASYDIWAWKLCGTILVEWEGMKSKKIDEAWIRKGKKEKILKDTEEGGEVGKWLDKGGLPRAYMGLASW